MKKQDHLNKGNRDLQDHIEEIKNRSHLSRNSEKSGNHIPSVHDEALFVYKYSETQGPGSFIEVNSAACRLLEYSEEELLSLSPSDINSAYNTKKKTALLKDLNVNGEAKYTARFITKSGKAKELEVTEKRFVCNNESLILCTARIACSNVNRETELEKQLDAFSELLVGRNEEISRLKKTIGHLRLEKLSAENNLRENLELFKTLSDNMPVMIWKSDKARTFNYFNKSWTEFTGRHIEDEMGLGWSDNVHPNDKIYCLDTLSWHFNLRNSFKMEYRLKRKDGQYRWILNIGVPHYSLNNEFQGYVGSCIDITERKMVEEEIHKNYDFQSVINSILNLSIQDLTLDEILSRALQVLLGIPWLCEKSSGSIYLCDENKNLILKAFHNLSDTQLKLCSFVSIGHCLCGKAAESCAVQYGGYRDEFHTVREEGTPPHANYCIPIHVNSEILGVINLYVSEEHKRDEKEEKYLNVIAGYMAQVIMRKTADMTIRKLSRAVEQTPDHIIITDNNGVIEYVNKAFEDLTGHTKEDWTGKTPRILKSGYHDAKVYIKLWDTLLQGKTHRGITINKKKNGELYYEEKTITPLKDNDGRITHFVSAGRDITERIESEKQLLEAKEIAERSEKLKSDFLAQMSHEIRTPINSILNFTGLLKYELEDKMPDELKSSFDYIDSGGRRLIRTIDLILNMSEIQSGSLEVKPARIDLVKEVLNEIIMELAPMARQKNIELNYENNTASALIMGDNYTLGQIFSNLIDNAVKFTSEGQVHVLVNQTPDGFISVDVSDTGVGISDEYLPKLFEPFSQEETGYTRRFEGNGLGLALVKKYVELNHAFIKVESEKGKGSRFTVGFKATVE